MSDRNFYRRGMAMRLGLIVGLFVLVGVALAAYLATRKENPLSFTHASVVPAPSDQNLLRNGNFERPELSNTWDTDGSDDGKATITTMGGEVYDGKQAVKLFKGKKISIKQNLSLPTDQTYKVVGYFKSNADQPVLTYQVGDAKSPETPIQVTVADVSTTAKPSWKSVTGTFSLPLSTYTNVYSPSSNGLPVIFKIKTPGAYGTVIVDGFKLSLSGDTANLIQNAGFESWKSTDSKNSEVFAWTKHDVNLLRDPVGNNGNAANLVGVDSASKAPYLDQDVTPLIVKGGDYTVSADVKGIGLGANTGWISVTQQVPSNLGFALVKEVNAMEANETAADTNNPCFNTPGPEVVLKTCRKYFTATNSWTNQSQVFHIDDRANRVWVNIATYAKGSGSSNVSFDNVSMIYKPVTQPTGKPVLTAPAGGATIKENAPTLQWTRMAGVGGNTNIDYYIVEVSDKAEAGGGGGFSSKVFHTQVDQVDFKKQTVSQVLNLDSRVKDSKGLTQDGIYYWHVKAFNRGGVASDWSDTWTFTVDTKRPDDVKKLSLKPSLGDSSGKVTVVLNWIASTDTSFAKYVINVTGFKDVGGKTPPAFTPIEITDKSVTTKSIDFTNLQNGDYTVSLKVVDNAGRANATTQTFSLYEDGFKRLNTDAANAFHWNVNAENKTEGVKISGKDYLVVSDHRQEGVNDFTGIKSTPLMANQFDMTLDFKTFTYYRAVDSKAYLWLILPDSTKEGFGVGVVATKTGMAFMVGDYSKELTGSSLSPFTVRVSMDGKGQVTTYYNGTAVQPTTPIVIPGKDFGGVKIGVRNPANGAAVDASFDNFRIVWAQ